MLQLTAHSLVGPGHVEATPLTVRHWGHNEQERDRVLQLHADSVTFLGEDGYLSIEAGQWRVRMSLFFSLP